MRRSSISIFIVLIVSFLPFIQILSHQDLLHTHDGNVQIPRIAAYVKALRDGNFPVRWAGDLNYSYGIPLFNFMYHLPYLIASFFVVIGLNLVNSFKLTLLVSFLGSGISCYLFCKLFFHSNKTALLITVLYQFNSFHLLEIFTRGAFGGIYVYTFFPLVLYCLTKLYQKQTMNWLLLTSFVTFLLIISHNSLSLIFYIIAMLYTFVLTKKIKNLSILLFSLIGGLVLSSYYWIPAIFEHKYTYGDLYMTDLWKQHFPTLLSFFIPNFNNDVSGRIGGIATQIGLIHLISIAVSIYSLITQKNSQIIKRMILFCLCLTIISIFFMQPISTIFWKNSSLLRQFQFPWRFLAVITFTSSFLGFSLSSLAIFKSSFGYVLLLLLIMASSYPYWTPTEGFDKPVSENLYWDDPRTTTYWGETDVIWTEGQAKSYPKEKISIIGGEGTIQNLKFTTINQIFTLTAFTDTQLVSNTVYFPGWHVYIDNKSTPIEFQDMNWRGLITFRATQGTHQVAIRFEESPLRILADMLSLGFAGLALVLLVYKKNKPL